MANEHALRMSEQDFRRCLETASNATRVGDVERVRREVLIRWRGDPKAAVLADTLFEQEERLQER
jgi:hypothetical protein